MDRKTEELRDIFLSVSEEEEVTERQQEGHGSLASEEEVQRRLTRAVRRIREDRSVAAEFDDDQLAAVVRRFYAGEDDDAIAAGLDGDHSADQVRRARLELHLFRDGDRDAPFDLDALREAVDEGVPTSEFAAERDLEESTVARFRRVVEAERERRRVSDRYRNRLESALQDRDLAERLTDTSDQEVIRETTEGQETNVNL